MARRVIGELVAKLEMDSGDFVRDARGAEQATQDLADGMDRGFGRASRSSNALGSALGGALGFNFISKLRKARAEQRNLADETRALTEVMHSGGPSIQEWEGMLNDMAQRALEARDRVRKLKLTAEKAAIALAGAVAVGVIAGFKRLNDQARLAGEALNEMRNQAFGVRVALDEFQQWSNFLATAGLRGDDFNDVLNEISVKLGDVEKGLSGPTEAVTFFGLRWKDAAGDIRESIDLLPELLDAIEARGGPGPRVRHELDALLGGDIARRILPLLSMEKDRREELLELAKDGVVNQEAANKLANVHAKDVLRSAGNQARLNEATSDWLPILEKARNLWSQISRYGSSVLERVGRSLSVQFGTLTRDTATNIELIEDRITEITRQIDRFRWQPQVKPGLFAELQTLISLRKELLVAGAETRADSVDDDEVPEITIPVHTILTPDLSTFYMDAENRARFLRELFARNQTRLLDEQRQAAAEAEAFARAQAALELRLAESVRVENIKIAEQMRSAWESVGTSISQIITQSKSWADVMRNVLGLVVQFGAFLVGGGEGGLRGFFGFPGLQYGGPVTSGSPYIVGERGPELFVPSSAGRIERNEALAPQGSATININAATTMTQAEFDTFLSRSLPEVQRALGLNGGPNG